MFYCKNEEPELQYSGYCDEQTCRWFCLWYFSSTTPVSFTIFHRFVWDPVDDSNAHRPANYYSVACYAETHTAYRIYIQLTVYVNGCWYHRLQLIESEGKRHSSSSHIVVCGPRTKHRSTVTRSWNAGVGSCSQERPSFLCRIVLKKGSSFCLSPYCSSLFRNLDPQLSRNLICDHIIA